MTRAAGISVDSKVEQSGECVYGTVDATKMGELER